MLYLFFALEALLGDRSEGLKANILAFRQLILSHVATGGFREPNRTWLLYDGVRSAAVHGEQLPVVDDGTVRDFEWSVRDTLNDYLAFASSPNIGRRGKLIQALTSHPDVPQLVDWIRKYAGPGWKAYLGKVIPTAEATERTIGLVGSLLEKYGAPAAMRDQAEDELRKVEGEISRLDASKARVRESLRKVQQKVVEGGARALSQARGRPRSVRLSRLAQHLPMRVFEE